MNFTPADITNARRLRGIVRRQNGNGPWLDWYMVDIARGFGWRVYDDCVWFALGWFRLGIGWDVLPWAKMYARDRYTLINGRYWKARPNHVSLLRK